MMIAAPIAAQTMAMPSQSAHTHPGHFQNTKRTYTGRRRIKMIATGNVANQRAD
jgi:hypothetical protein